MEAAVAADEPSTAEIRSLHSVPPRTATAEPDVTGLAEELAAALRAVRGYVPQRIWWHAGAGQALLAYQAQLEG